MNAGRAIIESSSAEEVEQAIACLQKMFNNISATIPVMTYDGRYISSVYYSNETINKEMTK